MSRRDDSQRLDRLFEAALGGAASGAAPTALSDAPPPPAPLDPATILLESTESAERRCPRCRQVLELKRITCASCYTLDFAPVLTKGQRSLVHRMAIVGLAGCGKTVLLTQLFWHLWHDANGNPAFPWDVQLETASTRRFVQEGRERIANGLWPLKTAELASEAIFAAVRPRAGGKRFKLLITDISGETVQKFFSQADRPEADDARAANLAHLFNAQSIVLLLDANRLTDRNAWDIDGFLDMYAREHGIDDEPKEVWVSLVITKSDELPPDHPEPEALARQYLRGTYSRLRECFKHVDVFLVSAAGKTVLGTPGTAGGAGVQPDPYALPVGVLDPLRWILSGIEAYDLEREARSRTRLEALEEQQIQASWEQQLAGDSRGALAKLWILLALVLAGLVVGVFASVS